MIRKPTGNDRRLRWGDGWIEPRTRATGELRWVARWREPTGTGAERVVSRTFPTPDAAEDHLRTVSDRLAAGSYVAPERLTVAEVVRQWIERGARERSESSTSSYEAWARMAIDDAIGETRVSALTAVRVQSWVDGLVGRKLAAGSIHDAVFVLRSACKEAVRLGIIPSNPVTDTRVPINRPKKIITWTAHEAQIVLAAVADDPMWHAAYRLHLATGMRPGEIRAVQWSDLDTVAGTITVRRTMTVDRKRRPTVGERTKTGRVRMIALSPTTLAALARWRKVQIAIRLAAPAWEDHDAIFTIATGEHVSIGRWAAYLVNLIAQTEVKTITPHGIRHTAATLMLEAGVNVKIVSEILGHSSVSFTMDRYQHVSVSLQRSAITALGGMLGEVADDALAL